ncbi:hypothetical protein ACEQ8H_006343 [Pleosporales sp. CAS-2024a]
MSGSKEMVIILTGASRGIGLATAHHLLSLSPPHSLVVVSRTRPALEHLQAQYGAARVHVLAGDVRDGRLATQAVEAAVRQWGRVDALIVNHGSLEPVRKVGESSVEEWRGAFEGNVFSAVGFVQAALPPLRSTQGRIVFVSSGAATAAYQGWGAYGAGKAVLNHLAQTLSVEEPLVTTISIRPGVVDTDMQREIREVHHQHMSENDRIKFAALKTDGQLLRPEQPGHVIAKLAVANGDAVKGLSGKFLNWNDQSLAMYQEQS